MKISSDPNAELKRGEDFVIINNTGYSVILVAGQNEYEVWGQVELTFEQATEVAILLLGIGVDTTNDVW